MFQNYNSEVLGFESIIAQSRGKNDNAETQTTERSVSYSAIQVKSLVTIATQTERTVEELVPQFDDAKLAEFLRKTEAFLLEDVPQLDDFEDNIEEDNHAERILSYHCQQSIKKVNCLSWNSRGGTCAVGYSVLRHESWCSHESRVQILSLSHKAGQPRTLPLTTCVTSLLFHPTIPSILAIGCFGGEVAVWDLSHDGDWVAQEVSPEHTGQVVYTGWYTQIHQFVSAGSDGCIFLRKIKTTDRTITTVSKFCITRSHLRTGIHKIEEGLEIVSMAEVKDGEYVVGVCGGGLLHCSASNLRPESTRPGYLDPVILTYQLHKGLITAVKSSPTMDSFVVASSDGIIRIFKTLEVEPRMTINRDHIILDLIWADTRSFGICGWNNTVEFVKTADAENQSWKIQLQVDETAVALQASPSRRTIAVGGTEGTVEIWQIQNSFK